MGPSGRNEREYLFLIESPTHPMKLAFARAADGSLFWPAFTDKAALLRWKPDGGEAATAPLGVMRGVMTDSGITTLVIDPGSPSERVLRIEDLVD
jgi:hypothetical protein